jgi:hypothetical protein
MTPLDFTAAFQPLLEAATPMLGGLPLLALALFSLTALRLRWADYRAARRQARYDAALDRLGIGDCA